MSPALGERGGSAFLENLGFGELLLIMIAALVIFGPSKLPELGRTLGQSIREFKKATQAISEEVTKAATEEIGSAARTETKPEAAPKPSAGEQQEGKQN